MRASDSFLNEKRNRPFAHLDGTGHRNRMRSRLLNKGASVLEDYEILEMLLYYIIPRKDTKPLAKHLLNQFGSFKGVCMADETELKKQVASGNLICLMEFIQQVALRLGNMDILIHPCLKRWQDLIVYLDGNRLKILGNSQNIIRLLLLNSQYYLIRDMHLAAEDANLEATVIKNAIEFYAMHLVLVHYVSGEVTEKTVSEFRRKEAHFSLILQSKARFYDLKVSAHILYINGQYIDVFK